MLVNVLLSWVPRPLTTAMIATEILAAINPYSMAVLPTYALDRLSRYEHTLWRQARQIVFTLESLRRRKCGALSATTTEKAGS